MAKGDWARVALAVAFLSVGMACKKRLGEPAKPAPEASRAPASAAPIEELEGELRLQREPVRSERARRLMALVAPLRRGGEIECSSTRIAGQVLLTAAHCVAAQAEFEVMGVPRYATRMACLHDSSCAAQVPNDLSYVSQDLATLWIPEAASLPEPLRLGAIEVGLPEVYMLSARRGEPHAICWATSSEAISSTDPIDVGDSGSSLVAVDQEDTAWILGVVSQRITDDLTLRAAKLPTQLPWRVDWGTAPSVDSVPASIFLPIEDCSP